MTKDEEIRMINEKLDFYVMGGKWWGSIERLLGLLWRETGGRTYNSRDEN